MRIAILFFFVVGFNFCSAQSDFTKEIIGAWKLYSGEIVHKEADELEDNRKSDPLLNKNTNFIFKNDEAITIIVDNFELHVTYTLKDKLLTIGNRKFVLLKVTKGELIFTEKNNATSMKHTYKKIKKNE